MTLDMAIEHHKEKRKKYTGAKAVDPSCRNHGSCIWCKKCRVHSSKVREECANEKLEDWLNGEEY